LRSPITVFGNAFSQQKGTEVPWINKKHVKTEARYYVGFLYAPLYDALIMPGVKIGNGAIVSSRSVVTADVPAYAIVGGNPAKVIKVRFASDVVKRLEEIAWWTGRSNPLR